MEANKSGVREGGYGSERRQGHVCSYKFLNHQMFPFPLPTRHKRVVLLSLARLVLCYFAQRMEEAITGPGKRTGHHGSQPFIPVAAKHTLCGRRVRPPPTWPFNWTVLG